MKLLVYVPLLTPRIKYIFNFIFNDVLKTEVGFSVNIQEFVQSGLPKFCYAPQPIGGELFFKSTNLLTEHKISPQQISTTTFGEIKVPFAVEKSTLPFDVFAASFYFLSRYEEYLLYENPNSNLYPATASLQYKLDLLKLPVVDGWALILKNILLKHFPGLSFGSKQFSFNLVQSSPTAKAGNQNLIITAIGYLKSLIDNKKTKNEEKLDAIRQVMAEMKRYGLMETMQVSIPSPDGQHRTDPEMRIPKSYVKLIKNSVENDYSMHYNDHSGFRAGTCTSFPWYDLQIEKKTRLLVHPVAATDQALIQHKSSAELLLQINELLDSVKLVNGHFYFLSLCDDIRTQ
jgi:hypothetical protein